MINKLISIIFLLISSSIFIQNVSAQTSAHVRIACLKENFDKNVKELPAGFCGHDWREVLSSLKKIQTKKDKYETSVQYAARMKAEINKPLYASVSGKGNLAIVRQINPRYDANKSRYEINVPLDLMSTYKWVLTIVESTTATSNYLGQNAYGATRQVSEEVTQTVALHSTKNRIGESTHFINFPISPIEAKKLDGHQLERLQILIMQKTLIMLLQL